jgi:hypothetical protein
MNLHFWSQKVHIHWVQPYDELAFKYRMYIKSVHRSDVREAHIHTFTVAEYGIPKLIFGVQVLKACYYVKISKSVLFTMRVQATSWSYFLFQKGIIAQISKAPK